MSAVPIVPVVLCGGSGTRLWPVSRKSLPKQFVPLLGGKSLLEITLARLTPFSRTALCVASEDHRFLVAEAMHKQGVVGDIILEPEGRNTAAAVALAALYARSSDNDPILLVCPSDHFIADVDEFVRTVLSGVCAANSGHIVTFGVTPTHPSTAYGYIHKGPSNDDCSFKALKFVEKPDEATAQQLLLGGQHLWNAGIFMVKASRIIAALGLHAEDILRKCSDSLIGQQTEAIPGLARGVFIRPDPVDFLACRPQSLDYAVMEHHPRTSVVPFTGQWSDVGSWSAIAQLTAADDDGNRVPGNGHAIGCRNTYIHPSDRTVVTLGTRNLIVVDTPDAVLVIDQDHAENVKDVVAHLQAMEVPQALQHRRVARPWGWYDSVDRGERFQVKRIGVRPGASLSLQMHHHRAEHWIVVKGTAAVTRGKDSFLVTENESTFIPVGETHRLHNPGLVDLEMIEVQSGSYLGEDDIVRLEDVYGR